MNQISRSHFCGHEVSRISSHNAVAPAFFVVFNYPTQVHKKSERCMNGVTTTALDILEIFVKRRLKRPFSRAILYIQPGSYRGPIDNNEKKSHTYSRECLGCCLGIITLIHTSQEL